MAGKAGQINPERRAHLAGVRIYVAGLGTGETSRLVRNGFEEDTQDSRTSLAHSWSF